MALYGKYRPKNFADVVGQTAVKTTLLHAAKGGRVSHAYLLCGTRGTGKTTSARILAKAINCENLLETGDPCGKCSLCILAEEERLTDIIEIDAASNRGIDDIRDLRDKVAFAPTTGKAKIYIIDEVHMLTKEAFNALLKTLEEPPSHAYFILATTEFHKVPETIRSRCQTFFFRKISRNDIVGRLEYIAKKENFKFDRLGMEMIADRSNGGLRDAISLMEQSASYGPISKNNLQKSLGMISPDVFSNFFVGLQTGDSSLCMKTIDEIQNEGRSIEEFGKDFLHFLRNEFHSELEKRDNKLPWLLQIIELFEASLRNTRTFEIPPLALEIAIAKALLLKEEFKSSLKHIKGIKDIVLIIREERSIKSEKKSKNSSIEKIKSSLNENDKNEKNKAEEVEVRKKESSQETPPWEEKNKNTSNDIDSFTKIQSHWSELCGLLPSSIKLILLQYGACIAIDENSITIRVDNSSSLTLLKKEQNSLKISEIFSEKLEHQYSIVLVGNEENKEMEIEEVESLLAF